ncbi:CinA family protein [Pseudooceanicola aestuarii]|uniref:CinA family protein n=1 Tax=Pseudooceanicola aestuarii TaxID=2697319 RepID=UPI0013D8A96B|nr:CinA family protein [Pseudooceanicola aestuarii]
MTFSADTTAQAERLLDLCTASGLTIATAESCTGGLIAAALTAVPGSSAVVLGGIVSYANSAKRDLLAVPAADIDRHGAVSEPVVRAMARGAQAALGADLAVAVSGVAGPGGTATKPEGRVCFAVVRGADHLRVETVDFGPLGRDAVRAATCDHALALLTEAAQSRP